MLSFRTNQWPSNSNSFLHFSIKNISSYIFVIFIYKEWQGSSWSFPWHHLFQMWIVENKLHNKSVRHTQEIVSFKLLKNVSMIILDWASSCWMKLRVSSWKKWSRCLCSTFSNSGEILLRTGLEYTHHEWVAKTVWV